MSDEKTTTPIEEMKFNELRALAKGRGLNASGTKEELVARLTDSNDADDSQEDSASEESGDGATEENAQEDEDTNDDAQESPAATKQSERVGQQKADKQLKTDAAKMKRHLESQKQISIMIPFEVGENPENGKRVKFHVNLNGYAVDIPRGIYVDVPEQIADIIKARLESEGKMGADWRLDRDPNKQEALS